MPALLSVTAAAMPARAVPWPLGSVAGFEPAKADQPGTSRPARSGCVPSTPVSSTAIVAAPDGFTAPCTESHPIFGSAHCCAYSGSDAAPAILRVLLCSTRRTFLLALYFDVLVATWPVGTLTTATLTFARSDFSAPPPDVSAVCFALFESPGFNLRMRDVVAPVGAATVVGVGAATVVGVG